MIDMHIFIPPRQGSSNQPWIGNISPDLDPDRSWSFELLRHVDFKDIYGKDPFDQRNSVAGYIDLQRACTLIHPIVTQVSPGSFGERFVRARTKIKGVFHALLDGIALTDDTSKCIRSVTLISDAFNAWYSKPESNIVEGDQWPPIVKINPSKSTRFILDGIGNIKCTTGDDVTYGMGYLNTKHGSQITIDLNESIDIFSTVHLLLEVEQLYSFLIGRRCRKPKFKVFLDEHAHGASYIGAREAELDIGRVQWGEYDPPPWFECRHTNHGVEDLSYIILNNFFKQKRDLTYRMHAVEFGQNPAHHLEQRFFFVVPMLEQVIKSKFNTKEEINYIEMKDAFFNWIEQSRSKDIITFSQKHVQVVDNKHPSLQVQLTRAIEHINGQGYNLPLKHAERIKRRRGKLFHSIHDVGGNEISEFSKDVRMATFILMMLTFEDLGIDISTLNKDALVY